jgi:anti-sigma regulatory factor (Ser/Thr protein kinase)
VVQDVYLEEEADDGARTEADGLSCAQVLAADHPIPQQVPRETAHIHLQPVPAAAGEARRFIRSTATALDPDKLDDVLVLTSELVTNAVLHARTPFELGVTLTDDAILICVGDGTRSTPQVQESSDGQENGRGIMLVRALADDWGIESSESRQGKVVWFLLRAAVAEGGSRA